MVGKMDKIKLLILTPTYLPRKGGIEKAISMLSSKLFKNHDINISIITPFIDNMSEEFEEYGDIKVYRFCKIFSKICNSFAKFVVCNICTPFHVLYLYLFKDMRFDIINVHTVALMGIPSLILSKTFRKPLIFTIHHYGSGRDITHPKENGFLLNLLIKLILKFSNYIIVTSSCQEKYLKYLFGDHLNKINYSIIPFGACVESTTNTLQKYSDFNNKYIVFTIGRLVKRKRYDILLEIAKRIKSNQDIVFIIAGEGPEKNSIIRFIDGNGLKNVILLGEISDEEKKYWLLKADLYIQCSEYEGFGISYIEALSYGLPVLAYRNDAIEEIKENIKEGVYIFNSADMAVKILLDLKSKNIKVDKNKIMNETLKYYSWDNIAKQYYNIFASLIKNNT